MILVDATYEELERRVKKQNRRIVIYGAGMIGQIVVPYVLESHKLCEYVDCYVDMDVRKIGHSVTVGSYSYEIKSPTVLDSISDNTVILLTNSKFMPVIEYLDAKEALRNAECFIIPIMQKSLKTVEIPKVLHYCWFGKKEIPDSLKRYMETWAQVCTGYEIKRWDESNYDVDKYLYTKQAYESGKYGFVSDVARLDILYNHGGVYFDTDVKIIRPLDGLMNCRGFVGVECWGNINSGGGIGAVKNHPMIKEMLDYRVNFPFIFEDGSYNTETNGLYETIPFLRHGMRVDNTLQVVNDMVVYPSGKFHPYNYMNCEEKIENDTVSVHYFYGGWMDENDKNSRFDTQKKYLAVMKKMKCQREE